MFEGREFENAVTQFCKDGDALAGVFQLVAEVTFVEDDEWDDLFAFRCEQGAGDEFIREAGFGGNDDNDLIDIGGDQLLFDLIGAVEQAGTWRNGIDDALIVGCLLNFNPVTAGNTLKK